MELARLRPSRSTAVRMVLSLILAVLLWGWVTSLADPPRTQTRTNVSVSPGIAPDGMVVSTRAPTATIVASGPRSILDNFDQSDLALTLDLSSVDGPGNYTVPIVPVTHERFVDYEITPPTASIAVDEQVSRVFQLQANIVGLDDTNSQVVSRELSVAEVTITGPATIMETIQSAQVDLEVTGQTGTVSFDAVPVYALTNEGGQVDSTKENVTINPSFVQATLEIQTAGREVLILANVTGSPADGYEQRTTTTSPRTVIIDGPEDVLNGLTYVETEPVNISNASQTTSARVGIANLPAGVRVLSPPDGLVDVIVQIQQQGVSQTLPNLSVAVNGLGEGLTATLTTPTVNLEISALATQIPSLVSGAIAVSVDVTGLGPGTYTLAPQIYVPAGVEWGDVDPEAITVVITEADPNATPAAPTIGVATPLPGTP
ncbi:MAG TPA: CdaR family protein [Thermomicrobiales bacterium]|jgi:YbbR domain-containing protein|nr:CdaR family protein [Thermomicrobiales bacterium]